jgi:UDP-galactopyranose mutase
MYDYLIVGAGFAGCTLAERLSNVQGARVLLVDQKSHIAGNTYDPTSKSGIRYHQYGPHIFHTNSPEIFSYLGNFTEWRRYEHRVLTRIDDNLYPLPINRTTINSFCHLNLDEQELEIFFRERAIKLDTIYNSEEAVIAKIGYELYKAFFRGYTTKQWGIHPRFLDASVCGRIPVRTNDDDRYFSDTYQYMPLNGFAAMCEKMLANKRIDIRTNFSFQDAADNHLFKKLIYTGPIDQYYEYRFGKLPYRSLRFSFEELDTVRYQPVGCINEPDENVPYTRTTEYGHLTGQWGNKTIISREYPTASGDPYYPIPCKENKALYQKYKNLADAEKNVMFVGRLAEYRYYNMDQVVASALHAFDRLLKSV